MKKIVLTTTALSLLSTAAFAGGIERTNQSVGIIFEEGNYVEFTVGQASPDVSGVATAGGAASGNMADDFTQLGAGLKMDINDQMSFALIFDQPYGANVDYPTGTGYAMAGSTAELNSNAVTGVLRYKFDQNLSVFGGLRYQTFEAKANVTAIPGGYNVNGGKETGFGYLLGAAYEIPEYAFRAAITYNSSISTDHNTVENSTLLGSSRTSTTEVETPQSINVDLQAGIAEDTMVFGGLRWVDWSEFEIAPADYSTITSAPLVSYDDDTITYTVGLAHRLTDELAVSGSVSYEDGIGGLSSNLGPTDGAIGISVGAKYDMGDISLSGGVKYTMIGDADTSLGSFDDNDALGFGFKVGYSF